MISEEIVEELLEIYNFRCAEGGDCLGRIEIHHIKYRSRGGTNNICNLVPLCSRHHGLVHKGLLDRWCLNSWNNESDVLPFDWRKRNG